jgi:uroporphyrinogen III methyltransferase/synthase
VSPTRSTPANTTNDAPSTTKGAATPRPVAKQPGRVAFVGAGPGDAGLMTVRALEYLAAADHLQGAATGVSDANTEYHRTDLANADLFQGIPKA